MSYEREGAKKVPHTEEVFQSIEKRLKQIQEDFRELRTKMHDSGLESVELTLGTFLHHLGSMEPLAKRFLGKLEEQIVVRDVKKSRKEIAARIEASKRKK